MANVRPPRRTGNVRVSDDEPPGIPQPFAKFEERQDGFFGGDYDKMHPGISTSFEKKSERIQGPNGHSIESLVATLAKLHFTTKGKVGDDGKFELIFCSPDPVVSEVRHSAPEPLEEQVPVKKAIRYNEPKMVQLIEPKPHRSDRRRRHRSWFDS